MAQDFAAADPVARTLGMAAVNALSQSLFTHAGWQPSASGDPLGAIDPQPGEHIGMIGLFAPLVPAILNAGARLTVLELKPELVREEGALRVTLDPAALRDRVIAWIKREALVLYRSRIGQLAPRLGVPAPEVALSRARTQWGCCTRKRDGSARILLNWKLMHFELPLIDYVVAHELAHLRHMNHSPAFWREVARLYPDYQRAREALRTRGHLIPEL